MPYDENEKLKDQVGMLVGTFNSGEESIPKLAKVQLIQMGQKIRPYLLTVLEDMKNEKGEHARKIEELRDKESKTENYSYFNDKFRREEREIDAESNYSPRIVRETLDVLSFLADDSLVKTFVDWLPMANAVFGLIKIGSESAFKAVIPAVNDLFALKHTDEESEYSVDDEIRNYIAIYGYTSSFQYSRDDYDRIKAKIVEDMVAFVDKNVISDFILNFQKLSPGQKDLVAALLLRDESKKHSDLILKWIENGDYGDVKRLSGILLGIGKPIDRGVSKKLFSKIIANGDLKRARGRKEWVLDVPPEGDAEMESFLEFLVSNVDVEDNVEMALEILTMLPGNDEDYPIEDADELEIFRFLLTKLQANKQEAIKQTSKLLTGKGNETVKGASMLLSYLT